MRLKKVIITLTPEEVQEVLRIDMDGDPEEAFSFLRTVLAKKVKEELKTH
ncbi:hypothetical protein [Thermodesulforhabdus norvegica]|nr:hypothetical protein [Thermodesulforhabdus norvegica]